MRVRIPPRALLRKIEAGRIAPRDPRQLAHLLFGAICETAMVAARARDQDAALRESSDELSSVLRVLAV